MTATIAASSPDAPAAASGVHAAIARGAAHRARRRRLVLIGLGVLVAAAFSASLMIGHTFYGPGEVLRVIFGEQVPGASFTVGRLRLPRACLGALVGAAFGMAGVTFQTMLRNPLASPDFIGISAGASAAAVFAIVLLDASQGVASLIAIIVALSVAGLIYLLAYKDGLQGARLILVGIGIAAMLHSVVSYVIIRASSWDLQLAMRWLTGSLNGANWQMVAPLLVAFVVLAPILLRCGRGLDLMQLGDDTASALGLPVSRTRLVAILAAVALIAFGTAAAGPIAFVAFLCGPIAARLCGPGTSLLLPSALVGAALVLLADMVGQFAFETRYPVGVITGALGAPFLVYLLARVTRSGGSL